MNVETVMMAERPVTVITSDAVLVSTPAEALDLIANAQSDALVLHAHNFEPDFFDLSTRKLGEVLLKFTNYRVRLAVIGDFDQYPSKSLSGFIHESNRHGEYLFVPSFAHVTAIWDR